MKCVLLVRLFAVAVLLSAVLPASAGRTDLLPRPADIVEGQNEPPFVFDSSTSCFIEAPKSDVALLSQSVADLFPGVKTVGRQRDNQILLRLDPEFSTDIRSEANPDGEGAYSLIADNKRIVITSASAEGLYYGLQTLRQLRDGDSVVAVKIADSPRFPYRGMMLDLSRHFRGKDFVMRQIDAMSRMKLNRLHLHLTDGAGWRIEIDRYPRLTEYAAWRPDAEWTDWVKNGQRYCTQDAPGAYGGYFTKDDIREIVSYARKRHITVIPEIEMPSHSEEVTAAYPELSCTHDPNGTSDLCAGSEKTYEFLCNVLDEVVELFPSEYIHIGGDEASKTLWKTCEVCRERMRKENLKDVDELQGYMMKRMADYLATKGKRVIGWDETMDGGLATGATVMVWRDENSGFKAAGMGHDVIMVPGAYCYFDSYQDAPTALPVAFGGYLPIERVYSFNPAPDSLSPQRKKHIKGVQGTVFGEYVPDDMYAEFLMYPRVEAIAEIGWSPQSMRCDVADFKRRAKVVADDLKTLGINVFDLGDEIGERKEYFEPVVHKALGCGVKYMLPFWTKYTAAGEKTLTDGLRGSWNYTDRRWQGFVQKMDVIVDLGATQEISYVGGDFMQRVSAWVWLPEKVTVSVSSDGETFTPLADIEIPVDDTMRSIYRTISWSGTARARYVRFAASLSNPDNILFLDEIVVR